MTTPGGEQPHPPPGRRRTLRVLPVLAGLLVATGIAVAVSPGLRHQLTESVSRQDPGYLEIYFVDEQRARSCPLDEDRRVQLDVAVRSHFDESRKLAWTVTVSPTRGTVQAERGRLDLPARQRVAFRASVPVTSPSGTGTTQAPYSVSVALAGYRERLLLHCRA